MSFDLTNAPTASIDLKKLCVWSILGQACDCVSLTSPHYIRDFMRTPFVCEGRFLLSEETFLDLVVSSDGVSVDPSIIEIASSCLGLIG